MTTDETISLLVKAAVEYPLPVRIAAWFLTVGGTEESWASAKSRLRDLPDPIMNNVHNAIRDINVGRYKLDDIPSLGLIPIHRTTYISEDEAKKYAKIREQVMEEFPPAKKKKNKKS